MPQAEGLAVVLSLAVLASEPALLLCLNFMQLCASFVATSNLIGLT